MRVTRRVRPSQVGCAASVGRRRLYASSLADREPAAQPEPAPRLTLIIHPDGQIVSETASSEFDLITSRQTYHEVDAVTGR